MPNVPKNNSIFVRRYKNMDTEEFQNEIKNIDWSFSNPANKTGLVNEEMHKTDANAVISKLISKIEIVLDKHAPMKKISKNEYKNKINFG